MSAWTVIVYATAAAIDRARAWAVAACEADPTLRCEVRDHSTYAEPGGDDADLTALWCDAMMPPAQIAEFSDLLEEQMLAGVLLAEPGIGRGSTGILTQAVTDPVDLTVARLNGMVMRQAEIRRLRHELLISTRCTGGLRGEITRMHDELQLAAMVQREFLPRELPDVHGVGFAAMWQPASYVSGDIYDVIRLDEDHVGLFLADAVGHGVPAALLTMVICRSLPTRELSGNRLRIVPPAEALARLNEEMIRRQGRTTRFATAVYGVMNCRERTLTLAGAGHPSPLIYRASGSVESVETPGGLLGVFEDERFDQVTIELNVHDRLLLYSDGFEVAFPDRASGRTAQENKLPTTHYLEEFARLREHLDPRAAIESIRAQAGRQLGSLHQVDDLTLICVHAGPLAPAEPAAAASLSSAR